MRKEEFLMSVSTCLALALLVFFMPAYTNAASIKPLTLKFSYGSSSTGLAADYVKKAAEEVQKATEGRVKIEIYWSQSLVKVKENLRAVQKGTADMAWIAASYNPAELPLWTMYGYVLDVPQGDDAGAITRNGWKMWDSSKVLRDQFEKFGQTEWFLFPYDSYVLFAKKPVSKLEDFKGLRIRVKGEDHGKLVKAVGGLPVSAPAVEVYELIEKGTADGTLVPYEVGKKYSLYEVVKYVSATDITIGLAHGTVSLAALKKMSEKDRKAFMEVGRRLSIEHGDAIKKETINTQKFLQEKGMNFVKFPEAERARWAGLPAVKKLNQDWVEEQNKAGRPGTEAMETFLNAFKIK